MELLERESCIAELQAHLRDAQSGHGRVVLLGGEAGVGKSVLVRRFADGAAASTRVLIGACDPLAHPQPLGPLRDVVPELGETVRDLIMDHDRRPELFRAVLDSLHTPHGTIFVIEDAHWADEATLDLLRYLGRRIRAARALVIATYRDDEIGAVHPLRIVLGDLATSPDVRRMSVTPLSESAIRLLARDSAIDPAVLHRQTGGNPFFVTEVLGSGMIGVPPTVRDAVLNRAARLSDSARAVLDLAAVIGSRIEPGILTTVGNVDAGPVDECLAAGLLQVREGVIVFRHELAREALLSAVSPVRSMELHGRVLAALRAGHGTSDDLARLAHHAEAAGDVEAVLRFAPAAARRSSELGAHRAAAAQFARAVRFAARLPDDERQELLRARLGACHLSGQTTESLDLATQLLVMARAAGDRMMEAEYHSWLATIYVTAGRNVEADEASSTAIALLAELPQARSHAFVYCVQAQLRMLNRDRDEAIRWGTRASELAGQLGDTEIRVRALNASGSARLVADAEDAQGRADLEESLEVARAANLEPEVAGAFTNLGSSFGEGYRFTLAERYLTEGLAFTGERDLDRWHWYMVAWLALVRMYQGRWSEATELAQEVISNRGTTAISRIMALVALGRVRVRRGDPETWRILDEALALAEPTGTLQRLAPVRSARAEAAWLAGDRDRTISEARAVFDLALKHRHQWHIGELAYRLWLAGDLASLPPGAARPFERQIAGDWSVAAKEWERLGCPFEAARALGESCDEAGLRASLAGFDQLGARPMAAIASRHLREMGATAIPRGPRASTRENAARLTSRELDVLRLVARGQTNAEIATQLFLSPKTVQHHMTAILGKLGAMSRREAASRAVERGIIEPGEG
jgi:DNA-binding CsgD family transcriptional regulator/tetratricopeptide (TPR) repeat protein